MNNDFSIGQSKTIERYLSKKFSLSGANEFDEASVDMITEHIRDVKDKYVAAREGKSGDELAAAKLAFVIKDLPGWLAKIESILPEGRYAVGSSMTLADIYLFHITYDYFDHKEEVESITKDLPKIQEKANIVRDLLKDYIAARPVTPW